MRGDNLKRKVHAGPIALSELTRKSQPRRCDGSVLHQPELLLSSLARWPWRRLSALGSVAPAATVAAAGGPFSAGVVSVQFSPLTTLNATPRVLRLAGMRGASHTPGPRPATKAGWGGQ